jgi:hypothetical protein
LAWPTLSSSSMLAPAKEALLSLCSAGIGHTGRSDRASGLCKEYAKADGDVRYLLVCESLERIAADWEEYGAFPETLVKTLETAVLVASAVIGLLRYLEVLDDLGDVLALGERPIGLSQLAHT